MPSSSIGSACSRGGGTRRSGTAARSPVPYREQPMEYEPAIYCSQCGRKAPRWISWSAANPGRRYYACVEAQHGFIEWHNGPTSPFLRVLLGDLRDRIWQLEDYGAAICKDGDAGVGASCVELQKRNEQTVVDDTGASVSDNCVKKGFMLVCGIMIFVSVLVVGIILS
ncbi:uncharacterized protein LOC119298297 [Triticum dicoccoides]|uniref:uncharacterized protein LOC119298297 n=1 Tax=Triticum dicoccoides TaxID=85692 RepID=UPI001890161C|nr:uncharacterized protein LOC119298297 [Triticum dicoccoides]